MEDRTVDINDGVTGSTTTLIHPRLNGAPPRAHRVAYLIPDL
jgi:hypothetical protein